MKAIAIASLFATAALASSSSSQVANTTATASSLIPTGISASCNSFLTSLDSESSLSACTQPIISATSAFTPSSGSSSASPPSSSAITAALSQLCTSSASSSCSDSAIRTELANFYSACTAELTTSPNAGVVNLYAVLYVLTPIKQAVCSKDDSGNFCVESIPSAVSSSTPAVNSAIDNLWVSSQNAVARRNIDRLPIERSLSRRASDQATLSPNITTFGTTNLVFLFLQPSLSSSDLCTTCTRNILNSYTTFESAVPSALSLAQSPLLSGQIGIYNAVTSLCGASFLNDGAVQAAGGLKGGPLSGAAPRTIGVNFGALGMTLGAVAVAFMTLL